MQRSGMLWKHNSNELLQGGVLERSRGSMHCPKPKALSGRWSATRCSGCFTGNVHPCNSQWHFFIFFLYSLHTLRSLRLMPFAIRNVMIFASRSLRLWPDQRQDHKHPSDPWLYIYIWYVNIYIYDNVTATWCFLSLFDPVIFAAHLLFEQADLVRGQQTLPSASPPWSCLGPGTRG